MKYKKVAQWIVSLSGVLFAASCSSPTPATASDNGELVLREVHTEESTMGTSGAGPNCQITMGSLGPGAEISLSGPLCGPRSGKEDVGTEIIIKQPVGPEQPPYEENPPYAQVQIRETTLDDTDNNFTATDAVVVTSLFSIFGCMVYLIIKRKT